MYSQVLGLQVAGAIFALIAMLQLVRLVSRFDVAIAGRIVPLWANAIALVIAGALSFWMIKLSLAGWAKNEGGRGSYRAECLASTVQQELRPPDGVQFFNRDQNPGWPGAPWLAAAFCWASSALMSSVCRAPSSASMRYRKPFGTI